MNEIVEFFRSIEVKLTEEELKECFKQDVTEEEIKEARAYITSLGFDLKSFCTTGNQWLVKLFSKKGDRVFEESVRAAAVKIQAGFRQTGPFTGLIKLLYGIGFSLRDIVFTLYRLGFRGISTSVVQNHIANNKYEFDNERLKFMELIDVAKATVFQELQAEVKAAEKSSALIYLSAIEKLQEALASVDPVIEHTKFNRIVKQIDALQARINAMQGVEELRSATIQTASKITLLKLAKSLDDGEANPDDVAKNAKTIENDGEIISPFGKVDDNIITIPTQRLAS